MTDLDNLRSMLKSAKIEHFETEGCSQFNDGLTYVVIPLIRTDFVFRADGSLYRLETFEMKGYLAP